MSLREYKKKRNFKKTKEPKAKPAKKSKRLIFVVQEHHASHLHYDFRLELDGTLKSWAVPKGVPTEPKEKRLAVEVEDHPVAYAKFHGTIPEGEYGGGEVFIWDHGTWSCDGDARAQLKKGHLDFELHGERLNGRWMLVRTHMKAKKTNWLLIKRSDEVTDAPPPHGKKRAMPAFVEPELCQLVSDAPESSDWLHEIKYDGYRTMVRKDKGKLRMQTRSGLDWTEKYRALANEFKNIKASSYLIDGEIVWVDENGISQFDGLQQALTEERSEDLLFYAFDLLFLNGEDLRDLPLIERKKLLEGLIKPLGSEKILYSSHHLSSGKDVFASACKLSLEGIISKQKNSRYTSGRGGSWLKTKCHHVQEFVIAGYSRNNDSGAMRSLLMGVFEKNGKLRYIGKVGTGFNQKNSGLLMKKMRALETDHMPFEKRPADARNVQWLKPQLVANIEFGAWTREKILRHAAFKGLREDKKAKEVKTEEMKTLKLTHPEKIIFPKQKITKADLVKYYEKIRPLIMPHIKGRPLSLVRCPNGEGKACFFQKHREGETEDISIDTFEELLELIQLNALELHAWNCHVQNIDNPDLIVFDLDPDPSVGWKEVKKAALELKGLLDQLGLKSFLKVSGNKGLHLHVPVTPKYTWDEIKNFAKSVCSQLVNNRPDRYTVNVLKKNRKNKIFLDYLRNGYGATSIVPYSLRNKPNASVAYPISWSDLSRLTDPAKFTMKDVMKSALTRKDPWQDYFKVRQRIKVLDRIKTSSSGESLSPPAS